ncbi:MAG: phage protein Gp27 family protein [Pseudomonadota bacterium]
MPPPRKVDLLPSGLRDWLRKAISDAGYGNYENIADDLNFQLEEAGLELRIQKSAIHAFGQEHQQFVQLQEEASAWTKTWMTEVGLESEANTHKVLFQMINALAFKIMKGMDQRCREDPRQA